MALQHIQRIHAAREFLLILPLFFIPSNNYFSARSRILRYKFFRQSGHMCAILNLICKIIVWCRCSTTVFARFLKLSIINLSTLLLVNKEWPASYRAYTYQSFAITNHRIASMFRRYLGEDTDDIHKRKQPHEHGIDGLHVVAGIFSGNSPFLSLSMVLISREIREAQGFTPASGRKDTKRAQARRA